MYLKRKEDRKAVITNLELFKKLQNGLSNTYVDDLTITFLLVPELNKNCFKTVYNDVDGSSKTYLQIIWTFLSNFPFFAYYRITLLYQITNYFKTIFAFRKTS